MPVGRRTPGFESRGDYRYPSICYWHIRLRSPEPHKDSGLAGRGALLLAPTLAEQFRHRASPKYRIPVAQVALAGAKSRTWLQDLLCPAGAAGPGLGRDLVV